MDLAATEQFRLQDGMPAAANDLGSFINAAKSLGGVMKGVWNNGGKKLVQTGIATLPGGGLMNQVVDAIDAMARERSAPKKASKKSAKTKKKAAIAQPEGKTPVKTGKTPPGPFAHLSRKARKRLMAELNELD
jgi:hypothetical protein